VEYAFDKGINFIDTANMYEGYARRPGSSGGVAEECIGRAIRNNRSKMIIATKVGMNVGPAPADNGVSREAIEHNLTKSLQRLRTDYVDIYYAHRYDPLVDPLDLASSMNREIEKGRIRHYAVSNYTGSQLTALLSACDANHLIRPVMCQPPLSLLDTESMGDIIYVCQREEIAVVPYKILCGGLLSGKYLPNLPAPAGSRRSEQPSWLPDLPPAAMEKLEAVRGICTKIDLPMTDYAIGFVLHQQNVVSAIVGVKNEAQIDMAIKAADALKLR
jgi:aryl-alcohol dehydrogenase-like predicted oxidoreductase